MRIVLDLQGAQAPSTRNRGIGRYSLGFAEAVVRERGEHDVHLALNGAFPETITPIRDRFAGQLSADRIHVFNVLDPVPMEADHPGRIASEICREAFLARLDPDVVHISSFIEGTGEDAVSSIGRLGLDIPTSATFYDAIPLIYRSHYLADPAVSAWYDGRIDQLRRADLLLAISQSSAHEAVEYLKYDPVRVVNVGAAPDPIFQLHDVDGKPGSELLSRFGISRPFVMYTGGIDFRKNLEGLLTGYAALPGDLQAAHQLVITCNCGAEDIARLLDSARRLGLLGDAIVLTGAVEDRELASLYSMAKIFVFPSLHEGFGLPILEAMQCGAPVLGSNCSSMPEVIGLQEAMFDPRDPSAIRDALQVALTDEARLRQLKTHSERQATKFSWSNVGQSAIAAFEELHCRHQTRPSAGLGSKTKRRLAFVSPIPPTRSGIATYSSNLLPYLGRHYDIDVIVEGESRPVDLPGVFHVVDARTFLKQSDRYDRIVYQFGNSEFHDYMVPLLEAVPGVVVLHDFHLGGLIRHRAIRDGGEGQWLAALYKDHGAAAVVDCVRAATPHESAVRYPCCGSIVGHSLGLVLHSAFARSLAQKWLTPEWACRSKRIPLPCHTTTEVDRAEARQRLGLPSDASVVCSFGLMGPTKCNLDILTAWMKSKVFQDHRSILFFVGAPASGDYGDTVAEVISNSNLESRVRITGWTDDQTYIDYLAACDMAIQLRTDSHGETSLALLDCLAHRVPTIANASGSTAELPDSIYSVLPAQYEVTQLRDAIDRLSVDRVAAAEMGEAARRYVETDHAPAEVAQRYRDQLEAIYGRTADLVRALAPLSSSFAAEDVARLAEIATDATFLPPSITVSLDVSELADPTITDSRFRISCDVLRDFAEIVPQTLRLELVRYDSDLGDYVTAQRIFAELFGLSRPVLPDTPVKFSPNNLLICLDARQEAVSLRSHLLQDLYRDGLQVIFVIDDLRDESLQHLPSQSISAIFVDWLRTVAQSSGAACSSASLSDELQTCLRETRLEQRSFTITQMQREQRKAIRELIDQLVNLPRSGNGA